MTGGPCTSPNNNNCGGSSENIGIVDDNNVGCISSHNRNSKSSNGFCNGNQQFCVRWNSHLGSLGAAFPQLLAGQRFVDVTLSVDGHQVLCHRLVLAACSTYFERLLGENPCRHPIIILPSEIHLWEIQAIVDFMYKGEVNISQACLPDLLRCAEILQIRGLCGQDSPLSQMQNNCSPLFTHVNSSTEPEVTALNSPSSSDSPDLLYGVERHESQSHSKPSSPQSQKRLSLNNINIPYMPSICYPVSHRTPSKSPNQPSTSTHPYCNNEDEPIEANMRSTTVYCLKGSDEDNMATTTMHPMVMMDDFNEKNVNGGVANSVVKCEDAYETDSKVNSEYDDDGDNPEKIQADFALANVTCAYEAEDNEYQYNHSQYEQIPHAILNQNDPSSKHSRNRRIRRSEATLQQAAECVSRGQTFQVVSDSFQIPISTIRFFMARKGILPRRKRGRASGVCSSGLMLREPSSRSESPSEPPFHFVNYKLPNIF